MITNIHTVRVCHFCGRLRNKEEGDLGERNPSGLNSVDSSTKGQFPRFPTNVLIVDTRMFKEQ